MNPKPEIFSIPLPDGSSTSINVFRSPAEIVGAVLVIFPAMGLKGSYYRHYSADLSKQGIPVITIDHRGHGHSSIRASRKVNFGYREQVEMEYPEIIKHIKQIFPGKKIVIMGHSLGGQMGSMFVSRYPDLADGLILNASCSVYYKGWGRVSRGIRVFAAFCNALARALGYYPGEKIGFGGKEARGIIKDWYHTASTGNFAAIGFVFNYNEAMKSRNIPILGITYQGDTSAPPAALKNLFHKFSSAQITYHHILHPNFPKEKYDHYSWVKKPELSLSLISDWLKKLNENE